MKIIFSLRMPTFFLILLCSLSAIAAIFGKDDRTNITESSADIELARSVAISVLSSHWSPSSEGRLRLEVDSLSAYMCKDAPFAEEPSLSYSCTGFLVAPDLIATAGHCMVNTGESHNETATYCEAYSWLFDYRHSDSEKLNTETVPAENLYSCKEVIFAVKDEQAPFRDYALVRLDRAVEGRKPFQLSQENIVKGSLRMMGFPLGMPMKSSANARVLLNSASRQSFITNLDAAEGNSGSPVVNSKDEVVGILIGGTPLYSLIKKPGQTCESYNYCKENGTACDSPDEDTSIFPGFQRTGSEVQKIAPLIELLDRAKP